jgi:hypothetical protein
LEEEKQYIISSMRKQNLGFALQLHTQSLNLKAEQKDWSPNQACRQVYSALQCRLTTAVLWAMPRKIDVSAASPPSHTLRACATTASNHRDCASTALQITARWRQRELHGALTRRPLDNTPGRHQGSEMLLRVCDSQRAVRK